MRSALGKKWQLKEVVNDDVLLMLQRNHSINELIATLLVMKKVKYDQVEDFLTPKLRKMLPDPFHLKDMSRAVDRFLLAISNKEKICIFGDYDVDGATSSALIKNFMFALGVDVDIYIPDRILEGYGPSESAFTKIKNTGAKLVVTLDCGTTSHDAMKAAKEMDLDVIILDHHISTEILPDVVAVVNPNRLDEESEYKYLAAVGVAFLFIVAVCTKLKKGNLIPKENIPQLMDYLDLVALGTVCDVMKIVGLNRAFVTQGLNIINQKKNTGINALLKIAGIKEKISVYHLGYVLGPRINAGGRVGKSTMGSKLLSCKQEDEALSLACELDEYNQERKKIEEQVLFEAYLQAESQEDKNIIFVKQKGWHPGVIGIVAGRIKEKFHKPVAVIAIDNNEGKASCRSVNGVDLGSSILLAKEKGYIVNGGGHAMAAGFTVDEKKIDDLHDYLNDIIAEKYKEYAKNHTNEYHLEVSHNGLNFDILDHLSKLEPYGNGNSEPIILVKNVKFLYPKIVGMKHISCFLVSETGRKNIKAIAFGAAESKLSDVILNSRGKYHDIYGYVKKNIWQGKESVEFTILDIDY